MDVGVHVAYVVVDDQVHVSYVIYLFLTLTTWRKQAASTWRHVRVTILNLIRSLPSSFLQLKTGIRLALASSVKEIEEILQKLINYEPG